MNDRRRYSIRPGAAALTRRQWLVVGLAMLVGLVGLLLVTDGRVLGAVLMALTGVTCGLVILMAQGK